MRGGEILFYQHNLELQIIHLEKPYLHLTASTVFYSTVTTPSPHPFLDQTTFTLRLGRQWHWKLKQHNKIFEGNYSVTKQRTVTIFGHRFLDKDKSTDSYKYLSTLFSDNDKPTDSYKYLHTILNDKKIPDNYKYFSTEFSDNDKKNPDSYIYLILRQWQSTRQLQIRFHRILTQWQNPRQLQK